MTGSDYRCLSFETSSCLEARFSLFDSLFDAKFGSARETPPPQGLVVLNNWTKQIGSIVGHALSLFNASKENGFYMSKTRRMAWTYDSTVR